MSSHREAPEISQDPVADNTDFYMFVSPDKPTTVTMVANFIPLEDPAGGPNFFQFGTDVQYAINVDNDGDGLAEIAYQFKFTTQVSNPNTFLYNTGQITSLTSPNWNVRQFYTVTKIANGKSVVIGSNLPCPPCNVGIRSTPSYATLASAAIQNLSNGETVFAGQRAEGFYVDLGSIFDLGDLRPFQSLNVIPTPNAPGVDGTLGYNVHTIALQVPISHLTSNHSVPTNYTDPHAVLGAWTTASRQKSKVYDGNSGGGQVNTGPYAQISRLGQPLINEVIIPLGQKDYWNATYPVSDSQFASYYNSPGLAVLLNVLYPGVFPNLAAYTKARADLVAILLTGIPNGIIPGFQNYTGSVQSDMLRLNVAIPPSASPNYLGILGGDLAGYPNGRRVFDDVTTIELRAIAGATIPLVDPTFTPDAAASLVTDFTDYSFIPSTLYLPNFPYLGQPYDGYDALNLQPTGSVVAGARS